MAGTIQDKAYQDRMDKRSQERAQNKDNARRRGRLAFFGVFVSIILCLLAGRILYIKLVYGDEYERLAVGQEVSSMEEILSPIRGTIQDRNRQILVVSHSVDNIILDVRNLSKEKESVQEKTLENINLHLGIPLSKLQEYMAKNPDGTLVNDTSYLVIARGVSKIVSRALFDSGVKGIHPREDSQRTYVHNTLASPIIGFIRGDGSWGLENQYDKELSGQAGRVFNTFDNAGSVANQIPAQDGYTLNLTIDLNIQQIAETAAIKNAAFYEAQTASVIVMNPKTGEILAMAESNGFDPNEPSKIDLFTDMRIKTEMAEMSDEDLLNSLYQTWRNFNISDSLEVGSVFKPIIVAAALEENLISDSDTFNCNGGKTVLDRYIKCWIADYAARVHGMVTLSSGLAQSCNVMMMDIGALLGREKFYKYQRDFGFGEKTGIDLPGEMNTQSLIHSLSSLGPADIAAGSIGQGFTATPIQAINAFAALINGGNLMTPYIVSHVFDNNGNLIKETTPSIQRRVISEATSYYMRNTLRSVVDASNGTGRKAAIEGYSIGGKTGTAQQTRYDEGEDEYAQLFIAYLPAENPEILALATIYKPKDYQEGSTSAAPMLKEVLTEIIKYRGLQPTASDSDQVTGLLEGNEITLDDYTGKSTVEVSKMINKTGLNYEVIGSGDVIDSQQPAAGSKVSADGMVWLYLRNSSQEVELVMIPDIKGIPVEMAVEILKAAGLESRVEDSYEEMTVISEDGEGAEDQIIQYVTHVYPSPGVKVAPGTEIKLKIN